MDGTAMTAAPIEKPATELLQQFEQELDRYARIISMTEQLLQPVLLQHDSPPGNHPQEVQMHPYHSLLLRLQNLNHQAEDLRSRIRL